MVGDKKVAFIVQEGRASNFLARAPDESAQFSRSQLIRLWLFYRYLIFSKRVVNKFNLAFRNKKTNGQMAELVGETPLIKNNRLTIIGYGARLR